MNDNGGPSKGLVELLGQALVNPALRTELLSSPECFAAEYGLSDREVDSLRQTGQASLEHASSELSGEATALVKGFVGPGQSRAEAFEEEASKLGGEATALVKGFVGPGQSRAEAFEEEASKLGGEATALVKGFVGPGQARAEAFEEEASKLDGEATALVKGFVGGGRARMITRRRSSLAKAA